jgi:hypothetical protein
MQEQKNTCVNSFRLEIMSSNEILIQCQAKVSYFLYIIILNSLFKFLFSLIRTVFSNAVWITIFETSDAKKTI